MKNAKKLLHCFSPLEWVLWGASVALILVFYLLFDRSAPLTLAASLIGVTSLILCAKGNPLGQLLMLAFSTIYGILSFRLAYYGEVIAYVGMTAPMALLALISWLRHPYKGNRAEVEVGRVAKKEWFLLLLPLTALVASLFYFVLRAFGTANLPVSTLSVATSFAAVYLTFRRSPYYALAYAANDVVLITLWIMEAAHSLAALSVVACFFAFLAHDIYGFASWRKMEKRQKAAGAEKQEGEDR